ncbi:putative uncharacterized protein (plasmid) [Moritella viscosa]|nr:hypothetical protein [Moritella viscosa]CED62315.1 putative uncharacterized protein [Moritella viscosa]SHO15404.1 Elongation factor 4-Ribosomal back-translocase LepA [Moritella viscosa]
MNIYRNNSVVKAFTNKPANEEIIEESKYNERLKGFIIDLYEGTAFVVNDMVSMDEKCYGMAIWTLTNVYPNEDFYQNVKNGEK